MLSSSPPPKVEMSDSIHETAYHKRGYESSQGLFIRLYGRKMDMEEFFKLK